MRRERICNRLNGKWRACARLSTKLTVASIIMSVLFLTGCANKKRCVEQHEMLTVEATKRAKMDSVVQEELTETLEAVPAESVTMEIPIKVIDLMPEGSEYRQKKGRVAVSARRKGFDLRIEARSDSVPRVKARQKQRSVMMSREAAEEKDHTAQSEAETEVEQGSNGIKRVFLILGTGLLLWLMVRIGIKNRLTNN